MTESKARQVHQWTISATMVLITLLLAYIAAPLSRDIRDATAAINQNTIRIAANEVRYQQIDARLTRIETKLDRLTDIGLKRAPEE